MNINVRDISDGKNWNVMWKTDYIVGKTALLYMYKKEYSQLKYGFCKKSLRKNATLTTWTLSSFFPDQHWSGKKVRKKVFNWSELHFSEVTFYKIHILIFYLDFWKVTRIHIYTVFIFPPSSSTVLYSKWNSLRVVRDGGKHISMAQRGQNL